MENSTIEVKERNQIVDIIRGFAMLLVVLGHTMSGTVSDYSGSLLFQVIWTLQMPLFIIISGYVTRYSSPLVNSTSFWKYVKKRTLAYLLPWLVWTILIRGLIFCQTDFLNIKHLLWHMDSGYWFLVTIWTISMLFGIADLLSNKCFKDKRINLISHLALCGIGMVGLSAIGYYAGFGFFAIKLTIYYLPIYILGYLYGQIQDWLMAKRNAKTVISCIVLVSLGLWLAVINRFDFYASGDGPLMIAVRFITSILGCASIIGLISAICSGWWCKPLGWTGVHSLEIYLTHYLYLSLVPAFGVPVLSSMEGLLSLVVNFALTVLLTVVTIKLAQSNMVMNYLLYAKLEQKLS